MKFPLVSRARYELLEEQFNRILRERDIAYEARDRALDQLINRVGFEPVSPIVRAEVKQKQDDLERYLATDQFEDIGSGMLDESILQMASELGSKPS